VQWVRRWPVLGLVCLPGTDRRMGGRKTERGNERGVCRETGKTEQVEEDGRASDRAGSRERSTAIERETSDRDRRRQRETDEINLPVKQRGWQASK